MGHPTRALAAVLLAAAAVFRAASAVAAPPPKFVDISPDDSGPMPGCPAPCAAGGSAGRVHNLASSPAHPSEVYAASELGGLFRSADGGVTWSHLDGHLPTKAWDVAVDPGGATVYATSFYDGRVESLAGVEVSRNGGLTWTRPASATPPQGLCTEVRRSAPSGFGIAIRPGAPNEVLAGTNCGLARSTDAGDTWEFFDPTPSDGEAQSVWDVVALPGGLTYACGQEGVVRSPDGRTAWTKLPDPTDATGPYRGYCVLAIDPDFPSVVFVVFSRITYFDPVVDVRETAYFASFDGGDHWTAMPHPDGGAPKRVPMVTTNPRSYGIDVWLGAGNLMRIPCLLLGILPVCPVTDNATWKGTFTDAEDPRVPGVRDLQKAHGDTGDLLFDPTRTVDACPVLYSSDGGVYRNVSDEQPDCHDPKFLAVNTGLHAQLLLGMAGSHRAGAAAEGIHEVLQDVGMFATTNAGATPPAWTHGAGGDIFDIAADASQVVYNDGAMLWRADPDFGNAAPVPNALPPAQQLLFYTVHTDYLDQWRPRSYVLATRGPSNAPDVQYTTNLEQQSVQSGTVTWRSTAWPAAAGVPCGVQAATGPARRRRPGKGAARGRPAVRFYAMSGTVQTEGCLWRSRNQLWAASPGGSWTRLDDNPECPGGGFGIFAVDAKRMKRLYASCTGVLPPRMIRSTDGGATWETDQVLTDLMHGNGVFQRWFDDPKDGATFGGVQPVMVAFDPADSKLLVAGGYESGVFLSADGGKSWSPVTDPFTPHLSHLPHLPRPFYAYFDHDAGRPLRALYVGSVGRGVWRITFPLRRGRPVVAETPRG